MHHTELTIYQRSLKALEKKAPLLKMLLSLKPLPSADSLSSALVEHHKKNIPLFEKGVEENELETLFALTQKKGLSTFFIYGAGFGVYYKKFRSWLHEKKERHVLIFEDRIEILQLLLSSEIGYKLVEDPQVDLFYLLAPHFWQQNEKYLRSRLGLPFEVIALKSYRENCPSFFRSFKEKIIDISMDQNSLFSEYIYTSPLFYENMVQNLERLSSAHLTHPFFGKFKGFPAIICGAGPSMDCSAKALRELSQKALIFAGGTSLSVLNSAFAKPHLSLGIDPNPTHHLTYSQNNFFELPLIFRARMHKDALQKAHGPLLYTPRAIGYPLVEWIEKKLDLTSPLIEEGMNVVNFSLELAHSFGCNPIILVGCDLAYQGKNPYSSSCVLGQSLPKDGSLNDSDYTLNRGVYKKNGLGKRVYTLWKWVEEAKWMEDFAQNHPDTLFINTSLEGLKIPNFKMLSLSEVQKKYLGKNYDIEGIIHQHLMENPPPRLDVKQFKSIYDELHESLMRSIQLLEELQKPQVALTYYEILEEDLRNEIAYEKMLLMLSDLFDLVEHEENLKKKKQKRAAFLLSMAFKYLPIFEDGLGYKSRPKAEDAV